MYTVWKLPVPSHPINDVNQETLLLHLGEFFSHMYLIILGQSNSSLHQEKATLEIKNTSHWVIHMVVK